MIKKRIQDNLKEYQRFDLSFSDFLWNYFFVLFPFINTALIIANIFLFYWNGFRWAPFYKRGGLWDLWKVVVMYEISFMLILFLGLAALIYFFSKVGKIHLNGIEIKISDEGLVEKVFKSKTVIDWARIKHSFETRNFFYLIKWPSRIMLIPKRIFSQTKIEVIRKLISSKTNLKPFGFMSSFKSIALMFFAAFIYITPLYTHTKYQALGVSLSTTKDRAYLILQRSLYEETINPFTVNNINKIYDWKDLQIENMLQIFSLPSEKSDSITTRGSGWWSLYMVSGNRLVFINGNPNDPNESITNPVKYLEFRDGVFRELSQRNVSLIPKTKDERRRLMKTEQWKTIGSYKLENTLKSDRDYFEIVGDDFGISIGEKKYKINKTIKNFNVQGDEFRLEINENDVIGSKGPSFISVNVKKESVPSKNVFLYKTWIGETANVP